MADLTNLQTIGRSGMHRYDSQDHFMLTALLAVKNWLREAHDLWSVATEQTYHEARIAPGRIERQVEGEP